MKLYFSPGACSLSPHIVSREAGIPLEYEQVDNREKKTKSGADFWSINPKGYVPVLEIDNGQRLTEGPAIVQYLADQKPASGLMPAAGTLDRHALDVFEGAYERLLMLGPGRRDAESTIAYDCAGDAVPR